MTNIAAPVERHLHHATTMPSAPQQPNLTETPISNHLPPHNTPSPDPTSIPSASPPFEPLRISTHDLPSSHTHAIVPHDDSGTPPTSAISSSLDTQDLAHPERWLKKPSTVDGIKKEVALDQGPGSASQSPDPSALSGSKRTATGDVKRSSVNGLADVINSSSAAAVHSRTSSMVSDGSSAGNVQEISQQLRTKLKYAMLKVQNGWQSRNFDEVESLASQSPRSVVSAFHQPTESSLLSPRTVMARKYHRASSESDSSESTLAVDNRPSTASPTHSSASPRRALAPPADILPSSRRRPTPNASYQKPHPSHHQPRPLHPDRPMPNQRTPSQNAVLEADAVETLLFMASPSNSGHYPPTRSSQDSSSQFFSSQTSPLRAQFSQTSMTSPKRVAFAHQTSDVAAAAAASALERAATIDKILDDLSDDSDDELSLEQAFKLAEQSKPAPSTPLPA
ncbi:hypothetical protein PV10_01931 [Exophiala mesophila]|uniref:Uncharacterized protein n=1 Tax=Exophiala mesophila TaxID=212818 RepID=A0A0D1ZW60_EXOME|nr:uncharacterized protein PV10_01931 [Exophiala mesophila]KIV98264.1 hypothetical protein PV10_01931 [Exophiala mesophila]